MAGPIRVLVADDHPIVRGGLVALLGTLADVEVVGEAADGAAAVREALLSRPDVVILDLRMPVLDGVGAARRIARDLPDTAVLVLTMFDEDDLVADALAAGARGYLLKGAEPEEIERAIRGVAGGSAVLAPQIADHVLGRVARAPVTDPFPDLTAREREVLHLIAEGASNPEVAHRLSIAPKTVGNHVSAIFLKLGVATRAEAIVRARNAGYGT
ncbi:MAG: response regulator transcription factor [Propionibacteriaceae bacterium]|nr:response regulator transcription factor [Propionibacteriaceae bacterium]